MTVPAGEMVLQSRGSLAEVAAHHELSLELGGARDNGLPEAVAVIAPRHRRPSEAVPGDQAVGSLIPYFKEHTAREQLAGCAEERVRLALEQPTKLDPRGTVEPLHHIAVRGQAVAHAIEHAVDGVGLRHRHVRWTD